MVFPTQVGRTSFVDRTIGLAAFAVAVVLLRLPFRWLICIIATIKRRCQRSATLAEAQTAVAAVRKAGRWFPGRAACLENSLAAVLAAAARGHVVDWCIGARLAPYASHAGVETEEGTVSEPVNPDRPYLLLLRV